MRINANEGPHYPGRDIVIRSEVHLNGAKADKVMEADEEGGWLIQARSHDLPVNEGEEDLGPIFPEEPHHFKTLRRVKMYGEVKITIHEPAPDAP